MGQLYMKLNFDHIYQFWADQSQKVYSVEYCTGVSSISFVMSNENPFRHLYTSAIKEFKHR